MKVLCVCTANVSRSPALEGVLKKRGINAFSRAATTVMEGAKQFLPMREAMERRGYPVNYEHRARFVGHPASVPSADVVIVMEPWHAEALPPRGWRVENFNALAGVDGMNAPDPFSGDCSPDIFLDMCERVAEALLRAAAR